MRNCFFATSHRCWVVLFSWSVNCKIWPKSPIQKKPYSDKVETMNLLCLSYLRRFHFFNWSSINPHTTPFLCNKSCEISFMAPFRLSTPKFLYNSFFPDLLHTKLCVFSKAMNSNSKSTVCGNLISKKPNRKSGVSSAELVNRTGKTGVSPPNGKAVVFSDVPIKHSGGTSQMKKYYTATSIYSFRCSHASWCSGTTFVG